MLDKRQRVLLKQMFDRPQEAEAFETLLQAIELWLKDQPTVQDTEFATLKAAMQRDYQLMFLKELRRLIEVEIAGIGVNDDN